MDNEYLRLGGDDEADETVTGQGEQGRIVRKGMLREGEDADTMFKHADKGSAKHFLKAARRLNPGGYAPGRFYSVVCDGNGKVLRFEYERDEKKRLVVEGDGPEARLEDIAYDVRLTGVVCIVRDDIFQAVQDVKEYPKLASSAQSLPPGPRGRPTKPSSSQTPRAGPSTTTTRAKTPAGPTSARRLP